MKDAACTPSHLDRGHGVDGVSEVAETIRGAQVGIDPRGVPPDEAACRGDALEEWFAQAATGDMPDEGDLPGRVLLAAVTLPVHDAMERPPRPLRGVLSASGTARPRRVRGRVPAMTAFVSLVVLAVVTAAVTGSLGSSSTSPTPEVVTSARAPIDKLGAIVERSLTATVTRRKGAGQRHRAALHAGRRKSNERRARVERRVLVARHRANIRARVAVHARAVAPAFAGRGASPQARFAPAQASERPTVPRRSSCGPFDLC
jgi:hypothetical protein